MEAQRLSAVFYHGLERRSEKMVYYFWRTGAWLALVVRSCFCVFVYWGLSGGCKPRQLVCACVHVLVHGVEDYSVRECQYICSACALKNHQKILISPEA